ncbi:hypothetical protein [Pseudoroseomonas cervicalis]|uniref:hypothetical protein n=1 Tax=Teichococcus cervicalis TaxID=204525 RepID=UPI0022F19B6B|nr:hypothetical protein [Pseudoroseomonas cervicalis]WBV44266.1 hypothetical protein PFY06_06825 [Pseudoroseomonas cervicalis]
MTRSRPVEIDGRFVGIAIAQEGGWRFLATDPAARAAEEGVFAALPEMRRRVQAALIESRLPPQRRTA